MESRKISYVYFLIHPSPAAVTSIIVTYDIPHWNTSTAMPVYLPRSDVIDRGTGNLYMSPSAVLPCKEIISGDVYMRANAEAPVPGNDGVKLCSSIFRIISFWSPLTTAHGPLMADIVVCED
jgi:hypothetical protein